MNRYHFAQDHVTKEKFPKCQFCTEPMDGFHACIGPMVPSRGQRTNPLLHSTDSPPFQQIWNNANEVMLEVEDVADDDWDDTDDWDGVDE